MSQNPTSRSSKQGVCDHGQHEVEEVLINTVPCQPEQLTASFSALKYLQDRLLSLDMQAFYPFVQDVKGFLDECSASGSALINQAHAYNTHTYVNTFLHFFCQHFLTSPPGRSILKVQDEWQNFIQFKESFRGRKEDNSCKHQCWSVEWWSPSN